MFSFADKEWQHINTKRLFKNSESYVYDHNFLLKKKTDNTYVLKFYHNEEGFYPSVTDYYFNKIFTVQIIDEDDNFTLKIELINGDHVKVLQINRLSKSDATIISDFIQNLHSL